MRLITILLVCALVRASAAQDEEPAPPRPAATDTALAGKKLSAEEVERRERQKALQALWLNLIFEAALRTPAVGLDQNFYEGFAEFSEFLPGIRPVRTGDVGQPAQSSLFGLPPRFTRLKVDGLAWPRDIYGQLNLATIPESLVDDYFLLPANEIVSLNSFPARTAVMKTFIQYANGPLGSDDLRVRLRRALSDKLAVSLGGTFSNADGPTNPLTNLPIGRPYEGTQIHSRFSYRVGDELRFRYRFLNSDNHAGMFAPYFFDQQPAVNQAIYTQKVNLHSLELARPAAELASEESRRDFAEQWRIQLYRWRQELTFQDRARSGLPAYRWRMLGAAGHWQWLNRSTRLRLLADGQRVDYDAETLQIASQWRGQLGLELAQHFAKSMTFFAEAAYMKFQRLPAGRSFSLRAQMDIGDSWVAGLAYQYRQILPEPGEYANAIPGILTPAPTLDPAGAVFTSLDLGYRHKQVRLQVAFRYIGLEHPFTLETSDSLAQIRNAGSEAKFPALEVSADWAAAAFWRLSGKLSQSFDQPREGYLWWFVPEAYGRFESIWNRRFFQKDLGAEAMLRATYWGSRRVPAGWMEGGLPALQYISAGLRWDVQLRIHYKDAVVFLSFDNVFDAQQVWRPENPMRDRVLRWGIYWRFLD